LSLAGFVFSVVTVRRHSALAMDAPADSGSALDSSFLVEGGERRHDVHVRHQRCPPAREGQPDSVRSSNDGKTDFFMRADKSIARSLPQQD
jgi:hypothetical protein